MNKILIVGGTFDKEGGRPSKLVDSIIIEMLKDARFECTCINGGLVSDLHHIIFPSVIEYDVVLWFANVPNDEVKIRDVKAYNPKCILIMSKRNDNAKFKCLARNKVELWTFDKYKYYITWFEEHGFKKEDYLVKR